MLELNKIWHGDCLELMKDIPDGSIDFCCTDLPYGITACHWDKKIDLQKFWQQVNRVCKFDAAVALFSQMPFGAELIMSNKKNFHYEWIWKKNIGVGFLNAKKMPLRTHENILIFYRKLPIYNPQFTQGKPYKYKRRGFSYNYGDQETGKISENPDGKRYPVDVLRVNTVYTSAEKQLHSTQKPVDLIEYLIKTYTNEGETVLDCCMGSGTTAIAAINTNRKFIGFELDEHFFKVATERINKRIAEKESELF